jgi:hypothetical protein
LIYGYTETVHVLTKSVAIVMGRCCCDGMAIIKHTTEWHEAATAPKDKVILADVGWHCPVPCTWDAEANKWAVSTLNAETFEEDGKAVNVWWETEYERTIKAWTEMPSLPRQKGHK